MSHSLSSQDVSRLNSLAVENTPSRFLTIIQKYHPDKLKQFQTVKELSHRVQIFIVAALPTTMNRSGHEIPSDLGLQQKVKLLEVELDKLMKEKEARETKLQEEEKINEEALRKLAVTKEQIKSAGASLIQKTTKIGDLNQKLDDIRKKRGIQEGIREGLQKKLEEVRCVIL